MHPFSVQPSGDFFILRDDLLSGGTKRRALDILLKDTPSNNIFYAGTIMGHGALALAHACADTGKDAHIFICGNKSDAMVQKIHKAGATIHLQQPMPVNDLHAFTLEHANGEPVFPPGFDMPDFENALAQSCMALDVTPYAEIWTTTVTGTLARALKKAFPEKPFKTVSVVKSDTGDFAAPEKYHQPAKTPPPYLSCPYTDAKLWQFALENAAPNALIWNTAG